MKADSAAAGVQVDGRRAAHIHVAADQGRHPVDGLRGSGAERNGTSCGADAVVENDDADAVMRAVVVVRPQIYRECSGAAGIADGLIDDDGVGRLQSQRHTAAARFGNGAVDSDVAQ